jgi:hypothetical protein
VRFFYFFIFIFIFIFCFFLFLSCIYIALHCIAFQSRRTQRNIHCTRHCLHTHTRTSTRTHARTHVALNTNKKIPPPPPLPLSHSPPPPHLSPSPTLPSFFDEISTDRGVGDNRREDRTRDSMTFGEDANRCVRACLRVHMAVFALTRSRACMCI